MSTWQCKIGETDRLPDTVIEPIERGRHISPDHFMRRAVINAYKELTGEESAFCFSGWGTELTPAERAVVDDVVPMAEGVMYYQARCTRCSDPCDLDGMEWRATPEEAIDAAIDEGEWVRVDEHTLLCAECQVKVVPA